ncbi:helix-turn-helix domain-containing protein [Candidatus Woesearchaeota archaeon]|nr:helix-turn-helix domain-containing protein [Candidatus Woesearchaeota archaeon]
MRQKLAEEIGVYLLKKGFTVKSLTRTCFDIIARKGASILLIKILEDANSISEDYAVQMKRIASYINASSIIIAEKAGCMLDDYVVYARYGISTLNASTFKSCVERKLPFVASTHAGLVARIIGKKLRETREKEGLSISALSKKLGVSARMAARYEDGMAEVTVQKALKIYDLFGASVFDRIDVLSGKSIETLSEASSAFAKKYRELGFDVSETKKVPFDMIAKMNREIILTEVGDKVNPQVNSLARMIDADNLVIFRKKKPKDIPSITKEEFLDFEKAEELVKFIKEF